MTRTTYPAVKFNEVAPVVAFGLLALAIVIAACGRLAYRSDPPAATLQPIP